MTEPAAPAFSEGPLRFFPRPMREARRPLLAIPVSWLFCIIPSLGLGWIVQQMAPALPAPNFDPIKGIGFPAVFLLAILTPFIETLIMAAFLTLFRKFLSPTASVLASSFGWGIAHSTSAAAWGLVVWWPFLILSMLYLVWRERGFWWAILIPTVVHGLQNLGPAIRVAYA